VYVYAPNNAAVGTSTMSVEFQVCICFEQPRQRTRRRLSRVSARGITFACASCVQLRVLPMAPIRPGAPQPVSMGGVEHEHERQFRRFVFKRGSVRSMDCKAFFENVVGHVWVIVGGCSRTGERKRGERAGETRELEAERERERESRPPPVRLSTYLFIGNCIYFCCL
jgi:hypothetical protein